VIPFRFRDPRSAEIVETCLRQHVRNVSFFADPIELARLNGDRSWLEPRIEGVISNGRFRLWSSALSEGRRGEVRGSFAGVLHGRIRASEGGTLISGIVRPSLAGTITVGALIAAILNPPWPAPAAPEPFQNVIYALFLFAMVGVVVTSLIRPLIALKRVLGSSSQLP
jgi:hypothetical protein